jgi:hypothetical protein
MKGLKVFVLAFLVVLFLMGCAASPPKYITEVRNEYVIVEPPKKLYEPVKRIKPPYSKVYVDAPWEEKEEILIKFIKQQDKQIDELLTDRVSTGTWVKEQRLKLEKLKKEEK